MKKIFYLFFYLLVNQAALAQISGIINDYTQVTDVDIPCNNISVLSSAAFNVGDTVLIIQMKGATIDENNANTFGNITSTANLNNAGNYEFAEISAIVGNDIYFTHTLLKSYTPAGLVQLISVPVYTNDVTITGTLTAQAWNGTTGGVLVFEARATVIFNADINVNGLGFRGGSVNPVNNAACSFGNYYGAYSESRMGRKGEGIAEFILNKEGGRGKQANGGGGGHSNNTGGGGGGNYGAGGTGGKQASGCFVTGSQGIGGLTLNPYYSNTMNRIFLGGGGGGGQQNNSNGVPVLPNFTGGIGATPGGDGGGVVIINANAIDGNSKSILAKGDSLDMPSWGDSGGGGGAGGVILLSTNSSYLSPIKADANGGKGDRVYVEVSVNLGPGGGGAGGVVWVSTPTQNVNLTTVVTGGQPGISWDPNPGNTTSCECNYSATAGGNGAVLFDLVLPRSTTLFTSSCILPVELVNFTARLIQNKVKLEWTTASEQNNDYFIVERTSDLGSFTTVAKVKGSRNSTSALSYFAYDNNPPSSGTVYYRLRQVDIDGKEKNIGIKQVKINTNEKLIESIFPNPFNNTLTVALNKNIISPENPVEIKIYNTFGQLVYDSFTSDSGNIELSLSDLSPGIYNLVVNLDGQVEVARVLKGN